MNTYPEPGENKDVLNKVLLWVVRLFLSCLIIVGCIFLGVYAFKIGYNYVTDPDSFDKPDDIPQAVEVEIAKGASTKDIAEILKEKKLIKYPLLFRVVSRIKQNDGKYQQGVHLLDTSMDYDAIMAELKKTVAKKEVKRFTIPEGYEFKQIVEKLSTEKLIDKEKFIALAEMGDFEYSFLKDLPERKPRLEGYLFPETYEVYADATEEDILRKMLEQFEKEFKQEYLERAEELGMTVDEVITLASIIEREARLQEERPLISAVFHNRLKSKEYPLLQSCATVQYILGERKEVLSEEDTKIQSPYNTYLNPGLPPGPIASPGRESIYAALYPADVSYLFFVAKSDGSHIFSNTYEEHQIAQKKAQQE
ncbi:MAG: endolytic transglycosylase MltG [Clostridiaceae bacterium]|nr:endolytic transglycosylase MltG [Clostridiaceae bacterium]